MVSEHEILSMLLLTKGDRTDYERHVTRVPGDGFQSYVFHKFPTYEAAFAYMVGHDDPYALDVVRQSVDRLLNGTYTPVIGYVVLNIPPPPYHQELAAPSHEEFHRPLTPDPTPASPVTGSGQASPQLPGSGTPRGTAGPRSPFDSPGGYTPLRLPRIRGGSTTPTPHTQVRGGLFSTRPPKLAVRKGDSTCGSTSHSPRTATSYGSTPPEFYAYSTPTASNDPGPNRPRPRPSPSPSPVPVPPATITLPQILQSYLIAHEFSVGEVDDILTIVQAHYVNRNPIATVLHLAAVMEHRVPRTAAQWFFDNLGCD